MKPRGVLSFLLVIVKMSVLLRWMSAYSRAKSSKSRDADKMVDRLFGASSSNISSAKLDNNCRVSNEDIRGGFFWDYSVDSYSITEHTEYQFPKEQTLWYSENRIADVTKIKAMRPRKSRYAIFPPKDGGEIAKRTRFLSILNKALFRLF